MANLRKPTSAQSNAVRQAAYRQRHLHDIDGQGERINMVVTVRAKAQLERLARHYGVTQRDLPVRLVAAAERKVVDRLNRAEERVYSEAPTGRELPMCGVGIKCRRMPANSHQVPPLYSSAMSPTFWIAPLPMVTLDYLGIKFMLVIVA